MMEYKGYVAHVEFDDEADLFHGEIINTRDVIVFQGTSVSELREAFEASIEDYLAFCAERGEEPEKPFSGKFIVRLTPEQHRMAVLAAKKSGKSLNAWVIEQMDHGAEQVLGGVLHDTSTFSRS